MDQQQSGQADQGAEVQALHAAEASPVALRLDVPATSAQVADIRRSVRAAARTHGISEPQLSDIGLAITEACANVVTHAYRTAHDPGLLTVEAYRERRNFVVTVTDAGAGIAPRADSPGLGLGLALIARMTRRMEIKNNDPIGSTVLMAFAIGQV